MKTFFWKVAYAHLMVIRVEAPVRVAWDMATDAVLNGVHKDCSACDAVREELSYWGD